MTFNILGSPLSIPKDTLTNPASLISRRSFSSTHSARVQPSQVISRRRSRISGKARPSFSLEGQRIIDESEMLDMVAPDNVFDLIEDVINAAIPDCSPEHRAWRTKDTTKRTSPSRHDCRHAASAELGYAPRVSAKIQQGAIGKRNSIEILYIGPSGVDFDIPAVSQMNPATVSNVRRPSIASSSSTKVPSPSP